MYICIYINIPHVCVCVCVCVCVHIKIYNIDIYDVYTYKYTYMYPISFSCLIFWRKWGACRTVRVVWQACSPRRSVCVCARAHVVVFFTWKENFIFIAFKKIFQLFTKMRYKQSKGPVPNIQYWRQYINEMRGLRCVSHGCMSSWPCSDVGHCLRISKLSGFRHCNCSNIRRLTEQKMTSTRPSVSPDFGSRGGPTPILGGS